MATTLGDLRRKAGEVKPTPMIPANPAAELPLDTCAFCEQSLFGSFESVAGGDSSVYMSADRRARAESGVELPARFKCRHCGTIVERMPDGRTGQIGAVR